MNCFHSMRWLCCMHTNASNVYSKGPEDLWQKLNNLQNSNMLNDVQEKKRMVRGKWQLQSTASLIASVMPGTDIVNAYWKAKHLERWAHCSGRHVLVCRLWCGAAAPQAAWLSQPMQKSHQKRWWGWGTWSAAVTLHVTFDKWARDMHFRMEKPKCDHNCITFYFHLCTVLVWFILCIIKF